MAEYWKSTPTYWCKFCSQYIRDTPLEKKNHEASGKHQNNIQRSLRELHRKNDREERDKQRAKDEVARLNGIVNATKTGSGVQVEGVRDLGKVGGSGGGGVKAMSAAQQRKAHAEQLAALGVELPDELKREVTGMGGWQTVSERVLEDETAERSLADIVKRENESKDSVPVNRGVHRRKAEHDEADEEERAAEKLQRKAWGSRLKTYPSSSNDIDGEGAEEDLAKLLSGVGTKKKKKRPEEDEEGVGEPKKEESGDEVKKEEYPAAEDDETKDPSSSAPAINDSAEEPVKEEKERQESAVTAPPVVFFKKRKVKK